MQVIYARQPLPKADSCGIVSGSIFLAGPTPREREYVQSWRPEALKLLQQLQFDGIVFVPEDDGWGTMAGNYEEQTRWEWAALDKAACVVFWVPRDLHLTPSGKLKMPAFTTNVEFGEVAWKSPEKAVFGAPEGAPNMGYMKQYAAERHAARGIVVPFFDTLKSTLMAAMMKAA